MSYRKDIPYWLTLSKPDFQTRVTSQALVACRRHDKKAETAFPPTVGIELARTWAGGWCLTKDSRDLELGRFDEGKRDALEDRRMSDNEG